MWIDNSGSPLNATHVCVTNDLFLPQNRGMSSIILSVMTHQNLKQPPQTEYSLLLIQLIQLIQLFKDDPHGDAHKGFLEQMSNLSYCKNWNCDILNLVFDTLFATCFTP